MKSPDPSGISIRLEINVPARGPVSVRTQPPRGRRCEILALYVEIQPENNVAGEWPVLPDGAGLGTICATVRYDDPQDHVWAAVFPNGLYPDPGPDDEFHLVSWAVEGTPSADYRTWTWGESNPVKGAAHLSTGAPNKLAVWYETGASGLVYEGASSFSGVTDETPCGSSSGSEQLPPELAAATLLQVVVPDGRHAGAYPAARIGPRVWRVTIGRMTYLIAPRSSRQVVIRWESKSVVSKNVTYKPFVALFPGKDFGATRDVTVSGP